MKAEKLTVGYNRLGNAIVNRMECFRTMSLWSRLRDVLRLP